MAIENGAGRDMLSSGMATLADGKLGHEALTVTKSGYESIVSLLERGALEGAGVLEPVDT